MTFDERKLVLEAQTARQNAFAPCSNYNVGAAVLTKSGKMIGGCNCELASYVPLGVCAERVAIFSAISQGVRPQEFAAIAVVTKDGGSPCGACRQVIWDYCRDIPIIIANDKGEVLERTSTREIFPRPFDDIC